MTSRIALIALALATVSCGSLEDDAPPPPTTAPAQAPPTPQAPQPTTPQPTTPQPTAPQPTGAQPFAPAAPIAAPPAPPQLVGMYELLWRDEGPGTPQQVMPEAVLSELPGCIWMRWGWNFGEDGRLTVSKNILCRAPPDFGPRHGVCDAEFTTAIDWTQNGFSLRAPTSAQSRFVVIERRGEVRDTSTAHCSVRVGTMNATFSDIVPGPAPNRPAEVTLTLGNGSHMRFRAVDDPEVDYGAIIDQHER